MYVDSYELKDWMQKLLDKLERAKSIKIKEGSKPSKEKTNTIGMVLNLLFS